MLTVKFLDSSATIQVFAVMIPSIRTTPVCVVSSAMDDIDITENNRAIKFQYRVILTSLIVYIKVQ